MRLSPRSRQVARLHAQGIPVYRIAAIVGVTQQTIHDYYRKSAEYRQYYAECVRILEANAPDAMRARVIAEVLPLLARHKRQ